MSYKNLVHLILIASLGSTISCVQVKRKGEDKNETNVQTMKIDNSRFGFQWSLEDTGKAFFYRFRLDWNTDASEQPLHLFLNGENANQTAITSPLYLELPSGKDTLVEIKMQTEKNKWLALWSQRISTPDDIYIADLMILDKAKVMKAQRLFMSTKSKILTMGHPLKIEVQRLYSSGGIIETFPEGTKALTNVEGRSGGSIEIAMTEGIGDLTFFLRGENGGDGANGPEWDHPQADAPPAARDGKGVCFPIGGICDCIIPPANGNNGPKGNKGHTGYPGMNGGKSGSLSIKISEPNDEFQTFIHKSAGAPGRGGLGGPGQKGGNPSIAGRTGHHTCTRARNGVALGDGETGARGADGQIGAIEKSCLILVKDEQCN